MMIYTRQDLYKWCQEYEEKYGITSEELYLLDKADKVPDYISNFDRTIWLSFYTEIGEIERRWKNENNSH